MGDIAGDRGHLDEGGIGILGAKDRITLQRRQPGAVGFLQHGTPGDDHLAKIDRIGHGRYVARRLGRDLVAIGDGADETRQLAELATVGNRLHLVEKLLCLGEVRIDIGRVPSGKGGAAIDIRQQFIALVRQDRAVEIVAQKLRILHRLPGQFDARDPRNRCQIQRHSNAHGLNLGAIRHRALVADFVVGQHAVGITG